MQSLCEPDFSSLSPRSLLPAPLLPAPLPRLSWPCAVRCTALAGCGRKRRAAKFRELRPRGPPWSSPQRRNLTCTVDQPGFVEAFEQTAIFSKVSGFIQKYYVDIGQHVKKGDPIVEIFVPELHEDHQQKVAQVEFDRKMVSSWWPRANSRRRLPN